jgi:hypothetical protein
MAVVCSDYQSILKFCCPKAALRQALQPTDSVEKLRVLIGVAISENQIIEYYPLRGTHSVLNT